MLRLFAFFCVFLSFIAVQSAEAQTLPHFDFTMGKNAQAWQAQHDIAQMQAAPDGLHIVINGGDPYLVGPARDYPLNTTLWLRVRLKSEQAGMAQVFYFAEGSGPTEPNSVRFPVRAGKWDEARVPLPPLGKNFRLRFDPPGSGGTCVLATLAAEARPLLTPPDWPRPPPLVLGPDALTLQSGLLSLTHAHHQLGGFVLRVGEQTVAIGHTRPLVGYMAPGTGSKTVRWVDVSQSATMTATKDGEEIVVRATCRDPDGATWYLHRAFRPALTGAIHVLTTVQSDRDRDIVFLPMFLMLPGLEEGKEEARDTRQQIQGEKTSLSMQKTQALFAGLEYLDRNEPSSSEADIRGPGAQRQTPDSTKITFPLMAIQRGANYVGLIWDKPQEFTALFDSPDRSLNAGGHVMGLLFPGSDGNNRVEGSLLPYEGQILKANKPLVCGATIIGGRGRDVTSAVQQYVSLRGLPPVPKTGVKWPDYVRLAASGYLDSGIYANDRYRHAFPNFGAQPAADVVLYLEWLAQETKDRALQSRLQAKAQAARTLVPDDNLNFAAVGHVRYPSPALLYGHVEENALKAQQNAQSLLGRFDAENRVRYQPPAEGNDLGKTHFAPDANGLTAQVVAELLQSAVIAGDSKLIADGIARLRGLDRFAGTAPRGAQTWEVPLHTPDILASAYLVRAYTLGYEITGEPQFLEQAKYWAWTGVPFVYLVNPTDQVVGPYATIAVYGATQWVAPNWMGLPVQWCGLVYADALYRFLKYDPTGPWQQIAEGISASGVQQTWPLGSDASRQGLLPDSFNLRVQSRNDAAINPGTLLVNALRLYNRSDLYDFQVFRDAGAYVHAPCAIDNPRANGQPLKDVPESNSAKPSSAPSVKRLKADKTGKAVKAEAVYMVNNANTGRRGAQRFSFTTRGWSSQPYYVLISGLKSAPAVRVNRQEVPLAAPNQYAIETGRLILQVRGTAQIEVVLP